MELVQYFSFFELLLLFGIGTIVVLILLYFKSRSKRPYHNEEMVDADIENHEGGFLRRMWNNFLNWL